MEINPVSRKINPADLPLDRLAASHQLTEAEKVASVSHHFEAILLRQFLGEAQKPLLKSKDSHPGVSHEIYQDMIVGNLADAISKTGTFGLARSFQSQIAPHSKSGGEKGGGGALSK